MPKANRQRRPARAAAARRKPSLLRENVESVLWAVVLVTILRAFVIQSFRIPSESMVPTLLIGDFLFVNRFEYGPKIPFTHVRLPGIRGPRTGDVIVFQYPWDPKQDWIKRCIATGGQTVEVRDKVVYVDGRPAPAADAHAYHLDPTISCGPEVHPYPENARLTTCRDNFGPYRVPPGKLFMMGDNRENSVDSRYWGTVPMDYVKGRAMILYWSWDGPWLGGHLRWRRLFHVIH
ncbi:MAG TPA: signal peptidase I [Terriglobales bacterium]|nr:signal peptidase I [Terriglobales bacterium]